MKILDAIGMTDTGERKRITKKICFASKVEQGDRLASPLGYIYEAQLILGKHCVIHDSREIEGARQDVIRALREDLYGELRGDLLDCYESLREAEYSEAEKQIKELINRIFPPL